MRRCDCCPPEDCAARVQRYLNGDRAAGDALARRFTPVLRAIARRVLGAAARNDEADACQAAFLKVFARVHTWQSRCPFCDWLAVVATRRILDFAESTSGKPRTAPLPPDCVDSRPPPQSPEVADCLERMHSRLPPEWRRAYELAVAGETRESIAKSLGKSVRTIHNWLSVIRDEIGDCLDR